MPKINDLKSTIKIICFLIGGRVWIFFIVFCYLGIWRCEHEYDVI
ncbi:putative membrane protein [Moraxella catarrhalis]|uniref:Putative membrane protein n=1 Tax=Moraxella catarrhalis TaxID=480 RepID=A0A3S9QC90_MORCA|nr:putative membrane protein [Moraxella catarrhalis BBH18]AZQ92369.1 putative membrane protein [Moraxella catarrhalis]EKF83448.1 hypothetical protein MCRH_0905 [Moraxella catarrhalis RH4]RUO17016.1 putative membrane protein [Moraxella catarrhalis]